jgi:hypothetical protein
VPTALLSGPFERTSDVAVALKTVGLDVLIAGDGSGPGPGESATFDCYVQLPGEVPARRDDALVWARAMVDRRVLARLDDVARVAARLSARGRVVLVADPAGSDPAVELGLVRYLVEAVLAGKGRGQVPVAVMDGAATPAAIAAIVGVAGTASPAWTGYASLAPDAGFADWRNEVMTMSAAPGW